MEWVLLLFLSDFFVVVVVVETEFLGIALAVLGFFSVAQANQELREPSTSVLGLKTCPTSTFFFFP